MKYMFFKYTNDKKMDFVFKFLLIFALTDAFCEIIFPKDFILVKRALFTILTVKVSLCNLSKDSKHNQNWIAGKKNLGVTSACFSH